MPKLAEIAENFHRADLTKPQKKAHFKAWTKLVAERDAEVSSQTGTKLPRKGVGQGAGGGRPKSAITKAAEEAGLSRSVAYRTVADDPAPNLLTPSTSSATPHPVSPDRADLFQRAARTLGGSSRLGGVCGRKLSTCPQRRPHGLGGQFGGMPAPQRFGAVLVVGKRPAGHLFQYLVIARTRRRRLHGGSYRADNSPDDAGLGWRAVRLGRDERNVEMNDR
ncbi:hypothetical protein K678_07388 [Magnetospirillum fulvum MGU-K5]|uniref:Uncharacterized protein n=1 Tax=Magnetospirillum fulvum MGU-K5 TaxID=1316936 RepID=S9SDQ9_MAGFU|nr:hypothetical protein K678_07388 [Magnetospirillum fulvum MGU-K5]